MVRKWLIHLACTIAVMVSNGAWAEAVVFTDRAAWEAYIASSTRFSTPAPILTEDFNDIPNQTYPLNTRSPVGILEVFPFASSGTIFRVLFQRVDGQVDRGPGSTPEGFTLFLPEPSIAFGADFFAACRNARVTIEVAGEVIALSNYIFSTDPYPCTGFLGVVSDNVFESVTFGQERGDCCNEVFNMDNVSFAVVPTVSVDVKVKPVNDANCGGAIPVAIFGSATLDVTQIDLSTLSFKGLQVRMLGNGGFSCGMEDVDDDSYLDLVCQYRNGLTDGTVTGELLDGTKIAGTDAFCVRN